ncbi:MULTISPECIES: HD domain-containing protein [Rickettsia]|uniref:Guanosine polyphosphate pyrophosphohydrolase/synthetase n=7 Tax=Rickettsia TaxID=780 RepID=Q1RJG6_RICBR|nr:MULTISPECIES: HD domain-containing protein [Rickettsia]ABE04498.1 Guanosine polyphosphate pyrophosphohydrolase/synthetase [Rickettsia bellii RML369-C]ABV79458.1 Guanosine polyphosphate pyrophosphohydrolase/synthetase [Rickettsia bellii OSU 85-389]AFB26345.1 guanosine polyphosphate pyrophosphohydrolase/synthetase [Rickettsia philipii str. 364D]AFC73123.1 guanosine polyphosphate pyrophosphohydrolase/synthetase [Rickettsia montanensis str. OSU 85-930]ALN41257.1 guanosine polyphosphate pyrophos
MARSQENHQKTIDPITGKLNLPKGIDLELDKIKITDLSNCRYSKRLLTKIMLINKMSKNMVDLNKIKKAIYFAKKYHGRQKRETGEFYYSHPLEVAYMVSDYLFRTDIIVTSILHDCIEDTLLTKEMIVKEFGYKIAGQVEDLTRVKKDKKISAAEVVKILYQQKKKELLLIKLFDRLHNVQTIGAKTHKKEQKTILETLQVFLALATYLKIPKVARQLHTHCLNITTNYKKLNLYNNTVPFSPLTPQ